MDHKSPLRLICTTKATCTEQSSGTGSPSSTATEKKEPKNREVGKSLISFLTAYADAIDQDVKNILDL